MSRETARVEDITKRFGGVVALSRVSLAFNSGEVHAIVGENGAGKSTLVKILAGVVQPSEGRIVIKDEAVELTPKEAISRGVAAIYQERALVPRLSIAENILLGAEPRRARIVIDAGAQESAAKEALDRVGLHLDPKRSVDLLSAAEQQLVAIAKALRLGAEILILDEPTAAFTPDEVERLFNVLDEFRRRDVGIIYISHRLHEVGQLADKVTVLKDGVVQGTLAGDVDEGSIIPLMIGRELGEFFPTVAPPRTDRPMLRIQELSASDGSFHKISFDLFPGEILGFAGLPDSGKSALAACLVGALRSGHGSVVEIDGEPTTLRSVGHALNRGIGYVPPDRRNQAIFVNFSLSPTITLSALRRFRKLGFLSRSSEHRTAGELLDRLRIKGVLRDSISNLSGGNQQKSVLARGLCRQAKILVLDEPTAGVDVGARADLYALLAELAAEGRACVVISSDMVELMGLCHRIIVLREGTVSGEFSSEAATEEHLLIAQLPVAAKGGPDRDEPEQDAVASQPQGDSRR